MTETPANPLPQTDDSVRDLLVKIANAAANPADNPFRSGSSLHTFGDSHTAGGLAVATSWAPGAVVDVAHRWANLLATETDTTLTNGAISGSGHAYAATNSATQQPIIARMGQLLTTASWTGTAVVMAGYNDTFAHEQSAPTWLPIFTAAWEAEIARALIDGYVQIDGTTDTGGTLTVTTTGARTGEATPLGNPFPIGTPGTDPRRVLTLTGTQTMSVTLTGRDSAVLFFGIAGTTFGGGGTFVVTVNGVQVAEVNTAAPSWIVSEFLGAVVLRELPASAAIVVTNVTGSNRLWAVGWLPAVTDALAASRAVIVASPAQFGSSNREPSGLRVIARAGKIAAQRWGHRRVYFADVGAAMSAADTVTGVGDGADPDHPSRGGNRKICAIIRAAKRVAGSDLSGAYDILDPLVSLTNGLFYGWSSKIRGAAVRVGYTGAVGYIDAIDDLSTYYPLALRSTSVRTLGDVCAQGFSGTPATHVLRIGVSGGIAYVDSIDQATALQPMEIRGARVALTGTGPFRLPNLAAAPASPLNGDMYYDTTLAKARLREAGAWVNLV